MRGHLGDQAGDHGSVPVIYAGQAHQQTLPNGTRRGYFIGDGTGVGKGREVGAIILDNFRQGRTKAVWLSAKAGLIEDAKRDFGGVGGDANQIFSLNDYGSATTLLTGPRVMKASVPSGSTNGLVVNTVFAVKPQFFTPGSFSTSVTFTISNP